MQNTFFLVKEDDGHEIIFNAAAIARITAVTQKPDRCIVAPHSGNGFVNIGYEDFQTAHQDALMENQTIHPIIKVMTTDMSGIEGYQINAINLSYVFKIEHIEADEQDNERGSRIELINDGGIVLTAPGQRNSSLGELKQCLIPQGHR